MPDDLFTIVPVIVGVAFALVLTFIVVSVVRGLVTWSRNNAAPVLTAPATVVGRRSHTSGGSGDRAASTSYHVTFERQDGSRLELGLSAREYGMLADHDRGVLTSQGTRFKSFQRAGATPT